MVNLQGGIVAVGESSPRLEAVGHDSRHVPVLQTTVLQILSPASGENVLDCTLGLGGHALSFLEATSPTGKLTGLDADVSNLDIARMNLVHLGDRVTFLQKNFRDVPSLDLGTFDIVFADLGLSSPHVDDPERGFSFKHDGPLDLRYDRSTGRTAAELLSQSKEEDLVELFHELGEFHEHVRPLAKLLVKKPIKTTFDLRSKVEEIFKYKAPRVLPQVFQALRIAVNDELNALKSLLESAPSLLKSGGRIGILSYHSLEDRIVKNIFRSLTSAEKDPLTGRKTSEPRFFTLTKKPLVPSEEEIAQNPRSRSAKFRALTRN